MEKSNIQENEALGAEFKKVREYVQYDIQSLANFVNILSADVELQNMISRHIHGRIINAENAKKNGNFNIDVQKDS